MDDRKRPVAACGVAEASGLLFSRFPMSADVADSGNPQTTAGSDMDLASLLEAGGLDLGGGAVKPDAQPAASAEMAADGGEEQTPSSVLSQDANDNAAAPETEPPADAGPEPEPETEPDDVARMRHGFEKRIGKEVAKRKELEERLEAVTAEMAELKQQFQERPAVEPPTPENVLGEVKTLAELNAKEAEARRYLDQAEEHLDGLDDGGDPAAAAAWLRQGGVKLPEEADSATVRQVLKRIRRNADRVTRDAPQRREWLAQEQQATQQARQTFPWLADKASPEQAQLAAVVKAIPEIRRLPHWQFAGAVYVEGLKAIQARKEAAKPAAPVPQKPVARQPGKPGASPQAPQGREAKAAVSRAQLEKEPTRHNLDNFIAEMIP